MSTNPAGVETTVSRIGRLGPQEATDLKKIGFVSVINLRLAAEAGAEIAGQATAAQAAGMTFVHIPFSTQSPDAAAVEVFLKAVTAPDHQPAFIHCRTGNRAAALWFIKRVQIDGWSRDRALEEAVRLGLTSPTLKQFALNYLAAHET